MLKILNYIQLDLNYEFIFVICDWKLGPIHVINSTFLRNIIIAILLFSWTAIDWGITINCIGSFRQRYILFTNFDNLI